MIWLCLTLRMWDNTLDWASAFLQGVFVNFKSNPDHSNAYQQSIVWWAAIHGLPDSTTLMEEQAHRSVKMELFT